ncbi:Hypothetical protein SRAE_2000419800 [Strongyloides ratti]|uniref:Uncharacterized protein n=1 Tax=Strongyloides ratti TaxID=34506 RepID=A0A090LPS6_STRRB|nr:Hypothetical protein SRAE_2000419800 [Strongyloides ratti]CEF69550.1 Hypothetical protein SRAE_2000419800 [Strongyloides ratti]
MNTTISKIKDNKIINRRPHRNIFRKLDLINNNDTEMDDDTIITNIAIIEEILQRTKKESNNNFEASSTTFNTDKLNNFQNNNIQTINKTNIPKFFIGDEYDYQNSDS